MAWDVFFNNGITVASGGSSLLNGLLSHIGNELDVQEEYADYKRDLMFYEQQALSLDEKFSAIAWPLELDRITENGVKPEGERTKLPDKGFEIIEYGEKLTTSFLMYQWLKKSKSIKGADSSIKKEWMTLARDSKFLIESAMLRMAIDMMNVYTKWFWPITSTFGAGSPTPKGLPLFSTQHRSRQWTLIWRNMGRGARLNEALTLATGHDAIQEALDVHKNVMRLENWYKVRRPRWAYELIVSSAITPIARRILNENSSGQPIKRSGRSSGDDNGNAHETNAFVFRGNAVRLIEIELLWDIDKHGNPIGTSDMWFLRNPRFCKKTKCFKCVKLYDPYMKNYQNEDTDAYVVDIRIGYAVDHYGAECGLFGSKGDGDTAYAL